MVALLAAAGMAISPVAANAGAADSLSLARAGAPMMDFSALLEEDDDSNTGGGSTAVIVGVILLVLIGAAAISGNGGDPTPNSP